MGLASGQARLLSLTARLTDNEYRTQRLTNARLNLSSVSEDARIKYQDALSKNKVTYTAFNSSGNREKTDLTSSVLWQYQPTKNQYALINTAGKILVSKEDGQNFKDSSTLAEFLDKYDLLEGYNGDFEKYKQEKSQYDSDYAKYQIEMSQWEKDYQNYNNYLIAFAEWQKENNKVNLYQLFSDEVGTSQTASGQGGSYCYSRALNGDTGCYLHLLNHLIDYDGGHTQAHTVYASCDYNKNFDKDARKFTTSAGDGGMHNNDTNTVMKEVSDGIKNPEKLCDGDDDFKPDYLNGGVEDTEKYNLLQAALDSGREPTAFEILVSDYIYDPETKDCSQLKTLYQKAVDMYYIIYYINKFPEARGTRKNMLINFTEGDLRNVATPPLDEVQNPGPAPQKPTPPVEPQLYTDDKEKSQWYTNLWYRMNGSENSQEIIILTEDSINSNYEDTENKKYLIKLKDMEKNEFSANYEILPENLAKSKDWLNNVLSQGIVTMEKVGVSRTTSDDEFKWSKIIYTNATDIILEEDSDAIAQAEAKYTEILSEVDSKDKRYQMQLRSLDTEHNALQTEYNSVKSAVDKNITRSYKIFQG